MKKIMATLAALLLLCFMAVSAAEIPVFVDGAQLNFDVQPQMINERTMVPMRAIFEKLGATVMFDNDTETISAYRTGKDNNGTIILIQINNSKAFVDSQTFELDSPPVIINDRTLVPIRFVGEALGCSVVWNEAEQAVYIKTSKVADPVVSTTPSQNTSIPTSATGDILADDEIINDEIIDDEIIDDEVNQEDIME